MIRHSYRSLPVPIQRQEFRRRMKSPGLHIADIAAAGIVAEPIVTGDQISVVKGFQYRGEYIALIARKEPFTIAYL